MRRKLLSVTPSRALPVARALALLLLLLVTALTSACGAIAVRDSTPIYPPASNSSRISNSPEPGPIHDLAIMGVDFDPQLDVQRIVNREQVTMIVGVMNLGNCRENRVKVKASLWDADQRLVLARAEQVVESVAAGDVVPARLVTNDTPPVHSRYKLIVEIVPVSSEANLQNNRRTLDILVSTVH